LSRLWSIACSEFVLSPSTLPFDPSTRLRAGSAQDELRINSGGLIDVNQTKRIRKPSILNRKESRNHEIAS